MENEGAMTGRPCCEEKEYIPRKGELLQRNEINIKFCSVGCVIRVGCKEIAFANVADAMDELNMYVNDPYKSTKKWNEIFNKNE